MSVDYGTLEVSSTGKFSPREWLGAGLALVVFLVLYYLTGYLLGQLYLWCYMAEEPGGCQVWLDSVAIQFVFNIVEPVILGFATLYIIRICLAKADIVAVFKAFSGGVVLFFGGKWGFYYVSGLSSSAGYGDVAFSLMYFLMVVVGAFLASRLSGPAIPAVASRRMIGVREQLDTGYVFFALLVLHCVLYVITYQLFDYGGSWFAIALGLWILVALAGIVFLHASPRTSESSRVGRVMALVVAYGLLIVPVGMAAFLALLAFTRYGNW